MNENIENLLNAASEIIGTHQQEKQSGKCFNCVDICGVGTIETRHTEIIAALLDPQGNHGFGAESLKAFFRQCNLPEFADNCEDCRVQTEVKIPGRRPDIVIRGKDLYVVIENKTNTSDHYMQLADYRDWVEEQKVTCHALLYLTYRGYKAVDTNIKEAEYTRISYTETICKWLEECAGMQATSAADFCKQYADFIENTIMGDGTVNNNMTKTILADVESFKAAACINQSFDNAKIEILQELLREYIGAVDFTIDNCGIAIDFYPDKPYKIGFRYCDGSCFYGISRKEKNDGFTKCQLDGFLPATNWWIAYRYIIDKEFDCNWFDSDFLAAQWEKDNFESFKKIIQECIEVVKQTIKQNPSIQ